MLNQLLIWLLSANRAFILLSDNWGMYQIYFGMLSLVLVQICRQTCSEQILCSWKMLLCVKFHVTNHVGCKHQENTMQFWVDFFSFCIVKSFEFLHPTQVFINISFLTWIVQQFSRESAEYSVYMINSGYFAFVAHGFFNQMVKVSEATEDACRTGSVWKSHEKTNCHGDLPVSILITMNSRLGHGCAFWSPWTHSELIERSRWVHGELLIFFSWVVMKMISYWVKGFLTDNFEMKTDFF